MRHLLFTTMVSGLVLTTGCGRTVYVYQQTPTPTVTATPPATPQIQGTGLIPDIQRTFLGLGQAVPILEGLSPGRR